MEKKRLDHAEVKALGEKLAAMAEKALEMGDACYDVNWHTLRHFGQILCAGPKREPAAE